MSESLRTELAQLAAKQLRDIAAIFAKLDMNDRESLVFMINTTLRFTGIRPVEIGDGLGTSAGTIERWADGKVGPHPLYASTVRDWIVKDLEQRADMIGAFPHELGTPADSYTPMRLHPLAQ